MAAWKSWLLWRAQKTPWWKDLVSVGMVLSEHIGHIRMFITNWLAGFCFIKSMIRVASETMDLLAFPTILPSPNYPYTHRLHSHSQGASQNVQTVTSNNCKQDLSGKPHLQYILYVLLYHILWMWLKIGSKNAYRVWNCSRQNGIPAKWWVSLHIEAYSSSTKWW